MKVVLVNPYTESPQPILPLGLAYLAAALERGHIPVRVIDAWAENLTDPALEKRLASIPAPDLVGVSVMSPTYGRARRTIQLIRAAYPDTKIIVGGTHPSSLPVECLEENPGIDFVAAGEGDQLIVDLVRALENKQTDFSSIQGLFYRSAGRIVEGGHADGIKDLDTLAFPARHLFLLSKYSSHPPYRLYKRYATMITSRGCPYACSYCTKSVSGQDYRAQSPRRVIEEIKMLIRSHGIQQIHFYDDDFTSDMKRTAEICRMMLAEKIAIPWSCVTRVDLVDKPLLSRMRDAGCWLISYGVESGEQKILDNVRKSYKVEDIRRAFRYTKECGIRTLGYFMAGLPGETAESL